MARKPLDQDLYDSVVAEAKRKFAVWPSAYASGWVVKTYKERGGKYAGQARGQDTGLTKWFGEEWVDLSRPIHDEDGDVVGYEPCGRKSSDDPADYPKCRPEREAMRMSKEEVADAVRRKRRAEASAPGRGSRARSPTRVATYRKNPAYEYLTHEPGPETKTQAFKRWFGKSKVVDDRGRPRVVFHGTDNGGFYAFEPNEIGLFFSSSEDLAESYVRAQVPIADKGIDPTPPLFSSFDQFLLEHGKYEEPFEVENTEDGYRVFFDGQHVIDFMPGSDDEEEFLAAVNSQTTRRSGVYAVYLRIENPFVVNAKGANWNEIELGGKKYTTNELAMMARDRLYLDFNLEEDEPRVRECDGLILNNVGDSGGGGDGYADERGTVYVVFDPTQVKSAYNNVGTFDPEDDDIRRNPPRYRANPEGIDGEALAAWCASDESYAVLDETASAGSSWMAGACVLLAKALVSQHPGARLVGIEVDGVVQHVGALVGDVVYDALGAHDERAWAADWLAYEQLDPRTPARVVSLEGVPASALPDVESPATESDVRLVASALSGARTNPRTGEYQGEHLPPGPDDGAPMHDVNSMMPDYCAHPDWYATGAEGRADAEAASIICSTRGRPWAKVWVYRAVPPGVTTINPGDWVTQVRDYAKEHLESNLGGKGRILKTVVRAGSLFTEGNSHFEWGWWPDAEREREFERMLWAKRAMMREER